MTLRRREDEPTHPHLSPLLKFAGSLLAFGLGWLGVGFSSTWLLSLLMLPIFIQMVYGAYVWFQQPLAEPMFETQG
jgi:hypothetical protein